MVEHIEIIAASLLFDFRNIIIMKKKRGSERENIENKHVSVFGNGISLCKCLDTDRCAERPLSIFRSRLRAEGQGPEPGPARSSRQGGGGEGEEGATARANVENESKIHKMVVPRSQSPKHVWASGGGEIGESCGERGEGREERQKSSVYRVKREREGRRGGNCVLLQALIAQLTNCCRPLFCGS